MFVPPALYTPTNQGIATTKALEEKGVCPEPIVGEKERERLWRWRWWFQSKGKARLWWLCRRGGEPRAEKAKKVVTVSRR